MLFTLYFCSLSLDKLLLVSLFKASKDLKLEQINFCHNFAHSSVNLYWWYFYIPFFINPCSPAIRICLGVYKPSRLEKVLFNRSCYFLLHSQKTFLIPKLWFFSFNLPVTIRHKVQVIRHKLWIYYLFSNRQFDVLIFLKLK